MSLDAWSEGFRDAMKLMTRLADHIEARRTAWRAAVKAKADIDRRHVPRPK